MAESRRFHGRRLAVFQRAQRRDRRDAPARPASDAYCSFWRSLGWVRHLSFKQVFSRDCETTASCRCASGSTTSQARAKTSSSRFVWNCARHCGSARYHARRGPSVEESLWSWFHQPELNIRDSEAGERVVHTALVFDQFEEIFTHGQETRATSGRSARCSRRLPSSWITACRRS